MELLIAAAALVLALIALSKGSGYDTKLAQLKLKLGNLEDELAALKAAPRIVSADPQQEHSPELAPAAAPDSELQAAASAGWGDETATIAASPDPDPSQQPGEPIAAAALRPDMEQRLATRWFVWLGGAAIAIGGLLFVKYAYDVGLISPTLQIILGLIIGAGLVGAGEAVRRRMGETEADKSFVPAALSAAGIAIAFGSVLAAYTLYNLIGPTPAFLGLAAIALAALILSLRQGPLIAALGLIGSYVTPMLITSPDPSAAAFFPYVAIVQAASFAVLRRRPWHWLGYASIAGSLAWGLLWLAGPFETADIWPIGLFAFVSAAISLFGISGRSILKAGSGSLLNPQTMQPALLIAFAGVAAAALVLAGLVFVSHHQNVAVALFVVGMLAIAGISWFKHEETIAAPLAGLAALLVLAGWEQASFFTLAMDEKGYWSSVLAGDSSKYLWWMLATGAAFTLFGLAGLLRRNFSLPWAALAAGASFGSIFLAWARVDALLPQIAWAAMAAAAVAVLIAVASSRESKLDQVSSGLLMAGSAALAVFAADRMLDGIWFTMSLAVLALAYAWWATRSTVYWLGPIASALGSLATVRLFLARELWLEDKTLPLGPHWPLYGYGVPALLLWQGSRWLRQAGRERHAVALEGLGLGLVVSLVSLELRVLIAGSVTVDEPGFLEMAAHFMAWLGAAYGLVYRQRLFSSFVSLWGARVLLAASVAGIALVSCVILNPVVTNEPLQGNVAFNALLLAYAAPAVLIGLIALRSDALGWPRLRTPLGLFSLALAMLYVTLQTKRIFQGRLMELQSFSSAETYAYSLVWLACALLLLLGGIRSSRQYIRYAGLGVMALVVCKVFLFDMAGLEGLWRIASFVGLGLCLVGIGWVYQRFVQPKAAGG